MILLARLLNRFRTRTQVTPVTPSGPVGRLCHFQVSPPNEIELEASDNELKRVFERTTLSYSPILGQISGSFKLLCWPADRFRWR